MECGKPGTHNNIKQIEKNFLPQRHQGTKGNASFLFNIRV